MSNGSHNAEDIRIGRNIKDLREAFGVSRRDLGTLIGRCESAVGHLERGDRGASAPVRRLIADALGVPLIALTDDDTCRQYLAILTRQVRPQVGQRVA